MLTAKLLSLGQNTHCYHENSMQYHKLAPAYLNNNLNSLYSEIDKIIAPTVKKHNRKGQSYGESSGLLYLAFEELYRRYREQARFILLIRHPKDFVRSALARGFFNPAHPHPLEHLKARPSTEIGRNWDEITPFEKCLWYWNLVNGMIYDFFQTLPVDLWRIQPIETFDKSTCQQFYEFLYIDGFNEKEAEIGQLLSTRVNATPGEGDDRHLNPWSIPMTMGEISSWSSEQREIYEKWTNRLFDVLYPTN